MVRPVVCRLGEPDPEEGESCRPVCGRSENMDVSGADGSVAAAPRPSRRPPMESDAELLEAELAALAQHEADAVALAEEEALRRHVPPMTSLRRHVDVFAPSGVVDLSDREISAATQHDVDFGALPPEIAAGVHHLDLSQNLLSIVPARLLKPLSGLVELDLSFNDLGTFPTLALCQLPRLASLNLSHTSLESVTASAEMLSRGLPRLTELDLSYNRLALLPAGLHGLARLEALDLTANQLVHSVGSAADAALGGLTRLRSLSLAQNGCLRLPACVCSLPLSRLDVSDNRLSRLPSAISQLHGLEELMVHRDLHSISASCTCDGGHFSI